MPGGGPPLDRGQKFKFKFEKSKGSFGAEGAPSGVYEGMVHACPWWCFRRYGSELHMAVKMQMLTRGFGAGHFQLVTFLETAVIEVRDIHSVDHAGTEMIHTGLPFSVELYRSIPVEPLTLKEPTKKGLQVDGAHDGSRTHVPLLT